MQTEAETDTETETETETDTETETERHTHRGREWWYGKAGTELGYGARNCGAERMFKRYDANADGKITNE
eukprot:2312624-Rhodomonas_salina.1